MRLGLLTSGGVLVAKEGLSARAFADDGTLTFVKGVDGPPSPPATPWTQPMPIMPVKTTVDPRPQQMPDGPPDGTTLIDGATERVPHQLFTFDPEAETYGGKFPPQKFYQLDMHEAQVKLHPDYGPTTVWGFDGQVPGPLIQAKYGEPILVRFQNDLPSVKVPQASASPRSRPICTMAIRRPRATAIRLTSSTRSMIRAAQSIRERQTVGQSARFQGPSLSQRLCRVTPCANWCLGDPNEALGSLWYHDHHHDFTAQNVYKGMFGCYTLFDELDNGDETTGCVCRVAITTSRFSSMISCSTKTSSWYSTCLISMGSSATGSARTERSSRFSTSKSDAIGSGFTFPARHAGGSSRCPTARNFLPFWQISSDGNLLPNAVKVNSVRMGVAERADIIVDFSRPARSRVYLVNRLEQVNGRGPTGKVLSPGTPIIQINMDAAVARSKHHPSDSRARQQGIHLRRLPDTDSQRAAAAAKAKTRTFRFEARQWRLAGQRQVLRRRTVITPPSTIGCRGGVDPPERRRRLAPSDPCPLRGVPRCRVNGVPITPNTSVNGTIVYARRDVVPLYDSSEIKMFMRFRDMKVAT